MRTFARGTVGRLLGVLSLLSSLAVVLAQTAPQIPAAPFDPPISDLDQPAPRSASLSRTGVKRAYVELDRSAIEQAEALRGPSARGLSSPEIEAKRAALRQTVDAAFEARQRMQAEEIRQLRGRLEELEKRLAARAEQKDRIVDKRAEELLEDESLRWEPGRAHSQASGPPGVAPSAGTSPNGGVTSGQPTYPTLPGLPRQPVAGAKVLVHLKLFRAAPDVAQTLGVSPKEVKYGEMNHYRPVADFHAKLQELAHSGEAKVLGETVLTVEAGRWPNGAGVVFGEQVPNPTSRRLVTVVPEPQERGKIRLNVRISAVPPEPEYAGTVDIDPGDSAILGPFPGAPGYIPCDYLHITADLAASSPPAAVYPVPNSPPPAGSSIPTAGTAAGASLLRSLAQKSPTDYMQMVATIRREIERLEASIADISRDHPDAAGPLRQIAEAKRQLDTIRLEFQTQRQLAELQVAGARAEVSVAKAELNLAKETNLKQPNTVPAIELRHLEAKVERAEAALVQAEALLKLYVETARTIFGDSESSPRPTRREQPMPAPSAGSFFKRDPAASFLKQAPAPPPAAPSDSPATKR